MSYLARLKAGISEKAVTVPTAKTAKRAFSSYYSSEGEHISEIERAITEHVANPLPPIETENIAPCELQKVQKDAIPELALASVNENCAEFFNERAAIAEYDGGLSREDAEAAAREATEKHRRECWNRFEKAANAILSLPTWEVRLKAVERYRRERGEIAGQEMMGWVRHKSGLDH